MPESSFEFDTLLAFSLGELDPDTAEQVRSAVQHDAVLRERLDRLGAIITAMRAESVATPSPGAVAEAYALVSRSERASGAGIARWFDQLRHVVATLVFDSRTAPAMAGLRGAGEGYHVSYEAEGADIDVQVQANDAPEEGQWVVVGNVFHEGESAPADVALIRSDGGTPVATTQADANGNFRLTAKSGAYKLGIRIGGQVIILPDVRME